MTIHLGQILRTLRLAAVALALGAVPLAGQGPVPEGTVLTAHTSASWTDANGNSYAPVVANASVMVGFLAGVDVSGPAEVTPASPSLGNSMLFTVRNTGNGTDTLMLVANGGLNVGYIVQSVEVNGVPLALGEVGGVLATTPVPAGGETSVNVIYYVDHAQGGAEHHLTLGFASVRSPGTSDEHTVDIRPVRDVQVGVVSMSATAERLPSNGTTYSTQFQIANAGNAVDSYTLAASVVGAGMSVVSVNGTPGSAGSVTVNPLETALVDVVYTIGDVPAATVATLTLAATSTGDPQASEGAGHVVTVLRAGITVAKAVYGETAGVRDDSPLGAGRTVVPGEYLWYRIEVTSSGGSAAVGVSVTETLPAGMTFVATENPGAAWTLSHAGGVVTGTLSGGIPASESRYFWIRARVD